MDILPAGDPMADSTYYTTMDRSALQVTYVKYAVLQKFIHRSGAVPISWNGRWMCTSGEFIRSRAVRQAQQANVSSPKLTYVRSYGSRPTTLIASLIHCREHTDLHELHIHMLYLRSLPRCSMVSGTRSRACDALLCSRSCLTTNPVLNSTSNTPAKTVSTQCTSHSRTHLLHLLRKTAQQQDAACSAILTPQLSTPQLPPRCSSLTMYRSMQQP